MVHSTLFNLIDSAWNGSLAEKASALADATVLLQSLSVHAAGSQLTYRGGVGWGMLHLLAFFWECEQAASFLSLVIERGRESCGTTVLMSITTALGWTPLHHFAYYCSDLSLTNMVLREHPPSLAVLDNNGRTPLGFAELVYGNPERVVFFHAATTAFDASNPVALEALCGGSSPFLAHELDRLAVALRAAVAICLNRQEEAPSDLSSVESGVALSLLGRIRDFGRVGGSSDLLRRVLEYVGPYASSGS